MGLVCYGVSFRDTLNNVVRDSEGKKAEDCDNRSIERKQYSASKSSLDSIVMLPCMLCLKVTCNAVQFNLLDIDTRCDFLHRFPCKIQGLLFLAHSLKLNVVLLLLILLYHMQSSPKSPLVSIRNEQKVG